MSSWGTSALWLSNWRRGSSKVHLLKRTLLRQFANAGLLFCRCLQTATKRAEGQPFLWDLMAQTKIQGDPDYEILVSHKDSFASGVPVGYEEPIPPAPEVFRLRTKQSNLDSSEYIEEVRNYKSAVENKEGLETKFREDESKGMMFPT
eukprot:s2139_g9.t1